LDFLPDNLMNPGTRPTYLSVTSDFVIGGRISMCACSPGTWEHLGDAEGQDSAPREIKRRPKDQDHAAESTEAK
jgi:hypothetical protein